MMRHQISAQVISRLGRLMLFAVATRTLISAPATGQTVQIGMVTAQPSSTVAVPVTLQTGGAAVLGVQNDVTFSVSTPVVISTNGKPACFLNPATNKTRDDSSEGATFAFLPTSGGALAPVRALIFSMTNTDPIPDGTLYTCYVTVSPTAAGIYPVTISGLTVAGPHGEYLPATGVSGQVTVPAPPPPPPSGGGC